MARRTPRRLGDGSIFYDKTRRRWVAMVSLPTTDGTRRRSRRTFLTRDEAKAFLDERGTASFSLSADMTVTELLDGWQDWLQRRAETGLLAPNTVAGYGHASAHVRAVFGGSLAVEVTVDDVERFLAIQMRGHSGRYVVLQRNVLDQAYRWAQRNRLLTWNPAQLCTSPARLDHKPGVALTASQAQRLLEASRGDRLHALWAVMLGVGLRPGEAMALTWPCLDLGSDPGVLHVRHYLRRGTDGVFLGAPKTAQSSRSLDMPTFVSNALRAHSEGCETLPEGVWRDLVFSTGGRYPARPQEPEARAETPLRGRRSTCLDPV
jgi:integrase